MPVEAPLPRRNRGIAGRSTLGDSSTRGSKPAVGERAAEDLSSSATCAGGTIGGRRSMGGGAKKSQRTSRIFCDAKDMHSNKKNPGRAQDFLGVILGFSLPRPMKLTLPSPTRYLPCEKVLTSSLNQHFEQWSLVKNVLEKILGRAQDFLGYRVILGFSLHVQGNSLHQLSFPSPTRYLPCEIALTSSLKVLSKKKKKKRDGNRSSDPRTRW